MASALGDRISLRAVSRLSSRMRAALILAFIAIPTIAQAESIKIESFMFAVPEGWKSVTPSSPMRKAQLEVTQGSSKAEVTFFQFGAGQGGSTADNLARWFGQFPGSEQKRTTENVQVGPVKITFAMTEGTFSSGMPGGPTTPMPAYALCGAIMENSEGSVFIKMTGPEALVKASTEAFKKMVSDAAKGAGPRA